MAGMARENPLGLAIGAAALGFLAGLVVPSTRVEDERLGRVSDQVMDKVKETGQEALDRGRQVAQEVASTATETAKQQTQEQGQELADTARQHAQDVMRPPGSEPDNRARRGRLLPPAPLLLLMIRQVGRSRCLGPMVPGCRPAAQTARWFGLSWGVVNRPGFRLCWRIQVAGRGWDSRASREVQLPVVAAPVSQASTRTRLMASAVSTCCRWVLARPR